MGRIREYYNVVLDTWGFLKPRLDNSTPDWGSEAWWDRCMAESATVSGRYKKYECHDFAVGIMNATLRELQRICKMHHTQDGEKEE